MTDKKTNKDLKKKEEQWDEPLSPFEEEWAKESTFSLPLPTEITE